MSIQGSIGEFELADAAVSVRKLQDDSKPAAQAVAAVTTAAVVPLIAAGSNTWVDLPGASTSFTVRGNRAVKVVAFFSGYATGSASTGALQVRCVFGAGPTQFGAIFKITYNVMNQHMGWSFPIAPGGLLPFGPIGTVVTVKLQVQSPTGALATFNTDTSDYAALTVEEIG